MAQDSEIKREKNRAKAQRWRDNQKLNALSTSDFTPDTDIVKQDVPADIDMDSLESNENSMSIFNDEHNQYHLKQAMNHVLTDKQSYVLIKSFGLFGQEPQDLEIIAQTLGCSRERVRMIREKAIRKLRESSWMNNLKETKHYNKMENKQIIRLTESDLHNLIKESVNNILKEITLSKCDDNYSPYDEEMPEWYERNQEAIEAELDRLDGEADERGISHNDPRYRSQYRKIMRKYMH